MRVLVDVPCNGISCEENMGGRRIWGTNLGRSLSMLGYSVAFGKQCLQASADVIVMSAAKAAQYRRSNRSRQLLIATKVNSFPASKVISPDVLVVGSWLHGHSNRVIHGHPANKTLVLKHIEVPTGCWAAPICEPYKMMPRHDPRLLSRSATLCYHGNADHIVLAAEMHAGMCELARTSGLYLNVHVLVGQSLNASHLHGLTSCAAIHLSLYEWKDMTSTYNHLAKCDVGLVPNALPLAGGARRIKASTGLKHAASIPHIGYRWKSSANGGRAMVFAQVGLPFVADPELEAVAILASSGLAVENHLASTPSEWAERLLLLLSDHERRISAAAALQSYAKRELLPETLALPLHRRIQQLRGGSPIHRNLIHRKRPRRSGAI